MTKVMPQLILVANHKIQTGRKEKPGQNCLQFPLRCNAFPQYRRHTHFYSQQVNSFSKCLQMLLSCKKFNTMLKTTKRNFIKETALWTQLKAMHAHHTGLCEDRLLIIPENFQIYPWKYIKPPCRKQEIDFTLKQKLVTFFSQAYYRHLSWDLQAREQRNREKSVQPDQRALLSPSLSNILLLALLCGILPQHFHSLQAIERILFPGLKFPQYLLHNM